MPIAAYGPFVPLGMVNIGYDVNVPIEKLLSNDSKDRDEMNSIISEARQRLGENSMSEKTGFATDDYEGF